MASTVVPDTAIKNANDVKTQTSTDQIESNTISKSDITTKSSPSTNPSPQMSKETSMASSSPDSQAEKSFSPTDKTSDSSKMPSKSSSSSSATGSCSTITDKCSKLPPDSPIQPPNIKLPNRDQVEKYFFTALVYIWDFAYYVFCLSLKLIDNYIVKNSTVQLYWKRLIKRLDEQREAIKSKK